MQPLLLLWTSYPPALRMGGIFVLIVIMVDCSLFAVLVVFIISKFTGVEGLSTGRARFFDNRGIIEGFLYNEALE